MTASQSVRFNAYSLALAHLKENEEITKAVPAFETAFRTAKATLDAIASAALHKTQKPGGATDDKQQYRDNFANQSLAIALVIGTYAACKNELALQVAMNITHTDLSTATDQQLMVQSAVLVAKARELCAELKDYGISGALVNNFAAMQEQYAVSIQGPANVAAERRQAGIQIVELLWQLKVIFKEQLDALMLLFKFTHHEFYQQYIRKRTLVNPARRKMGLTGVVLDKASLAELAGVMITIKGTRIGGTTLSDGSYALKMPMLPKVTVVYKKEGYKPFSVKTQIAPDHPITLNVELEAA